MDINNKTFVVHVVIQKQEEIAINPDKKTQIKAQIEARNGAQSEVQIGALIFDKAPTKVLAEYSNYSNNFLMENTVKLPENTRINKYAIKLEEGK